MTGNDREVWEHLTSNPDSNDEIDYIAYAIFAHDKHEWMKHFEAQNGRAPNQKEIDNWISNLPPHQFEAMRDKAVEFFDAAARDYMAEEIEKRVEEAIRSGIVAEVQAAGSFWRQLFFALAAAIVAPLVIGAIIAFALIYSDFFPAVRAIAQGIPKA